MTKQSEELQILERLYYKGKNQHRAALFWKRVSEVRRYARRLDGVGLPDVVERLHRSFFGDDATHRYTREFIINERLSEGRNVASHGEALGPTFQR
jgi:hypothetical protein